MSTQYDFSDELVTDVRGFLGEITGGNAPTVYTDYDPGLLVQKTGSDEDADDEDLSLPWVVVNLPGVDEEIAMMTGEKTAQTYVFDIYYCCGYGDGEIPRAIQRQKSRVVYNKLMDKRNAGHWTVALDWAFVRSRRYDNEYSQSLEERSVRARVTHFVYEVHFEPVTIPLTDYELTATEDAYCDRTDPDANFADANLLLETDGTGAKQVAVVQFDISSLPTYDTTYGRAGSVQSASLKLTSVGASAGDLIVGQLTADWVEGTVTWNNLDQTAPTTTSPTLVAAVADDEVEIDLTTIVRNWHQTGQDNFGLLIYAQDDGDDMEFYSSEDSGKEPQLDVTVQW